MFKNLILSLFVLISGFSFGQDMPESVYEVITWNFKVDYTSCDEATIVITVDQKDGWHIYAQVQPEGGQSFPTELNFVPSDSYELVGKAKEYGTVTHGGKYPEKIFEGNKAKFKQKIKIKSKTDFEIQLDYAFMACLEACFAPEFPTQMIKVKGKTDDCDGTETNGTDAAAEPEEGGEAEEDPEEDHGGIESSIGFQAFAEQLTDTEYELVIKPQIKDDWLLVSNNFNVTFNETIEKPKDATGADYADTTINGKVFQGYADGAYRQYVHIDTTDTIRVITGAVTFEGFDNDGKYFTSLPTEFEIKLDDAVFISSENDTSGRSYWGMFLVSIRRRIICLVNTLCIPNDSYDSKFLYQG